MKSALLLLALPPVGCGVVDVIPMNGEGSGHGNGDGKRIQGTGRPMSETREARVVTSAEFSGALQVTIRSGAPSLRIEAQREILPHIRSRFEGGRLRVWTEGSMASDGNMRVWYTTPRLSEVRASGATTVDMGVLSGDSCRVALSGASKARATGRTGEIHVEASGASEADLRGLTAETAHVEATAASKVWMGPVRSLDAEATGASEVRYRGKPAKVEAFPSGASTIGPEA